jgi:hypothetical protein
MSITQELKSLATVDIFVESKKPELFIGRPYYLDYDKAYLLVADAWKEKVGGIPQGTFILAFYENENDDIEECLLLRALRPSKLPTDNDVIASMVEYYKDNLKTSGKSNQLDDFTKYTFSFSGLECRILGTFYKEKSGRISLGADVENFYSAHNYVAYKPIGAVLEQIVNFRDGKSIPGSSTDIKIGKVRYSSSLRFQENQDVVPVYVNPQDFLGKRTALFGMTRTGKSNTVKKIIEATVKISKEATSNIQNNAGDISDLLEPFDSTGKPKFPVGQIIFDINGEYANKNLQDEGTAIFDLFKEDTVRYSVLEKGEDFKVMKTNFYMNIEGGFELVKSLLAEESSDYISSFCSINLSPPEDPTDYSEKTRYERKVAAYKCCLKAAGFDPGSNSRIRFSGKKELNDYSKVDPKNGISLDEGIIWFTKVWENYEDIRKKTPIGEREWADDDLKAILVMLTRKSKPGGNANITGYRKLDKVRSLHSKESSASFEQDIINYLRNGKIVIVDLSQGDPIIQRLYSEKICSNIFLSSMDKFVNTKPNNFIQFYFEEAHNLFPKKDDKDLSQIYNRLAKEGAKLNIGMTYATQEVSSISSNILKNTQNWFIAHLNNDDELREIKKFYDFGDFCEGLIRYSAGSDKGFIRMKTYSNAFVVPVQIDRFLAK